MKMIDGKPEYKNGLVSLRVKSVLSAELHDISFAHRHRDVRVCSSHIAEPDVGGK